MLMEEHARGAKFRPFSSMSAIESIDDAYAVQRDYVRLQRKDRGVGVVGYKVGLTSHRMQAMCAIDRPVAGVILEDRKHLSGASVESSGYGRIGLEFEIAVRMARDLRPEGQTIELADVAAAVDAVCPAMEIVDDRHCLLRDYGCSFVDRR
jgi:2-keto-4-pentenoate hydratase